MANTTSKLKLVQADVVGLLNGCDYFNDLTLIAEDKADIQTLIAQALGPIAVKGGKTGIVVVIEEPEAEAPTTIPAPYLTSVKQKLTILENMSVNRGSSLGTGKKAYEVAEIILACLWEIHIPGTADGPCWPGSPAIRPIGAIPDRPQIIGVEVMLEFHVNLPGVARVADPVITQGTPNINIACPTGGSAIFYSIDQSTPSIPYVEFATPAVGTIIRAMATLTTHATSNIVAHEVTA